MARCAPSPAKGRVGVGYEVQNQELKMYLNKVLALKTPSQPHPSQGEELKHLMFHTFDKGFTGSFRTQTFGFIEQFQGFINVSGFHCFLNRVVKVGF